MFIESRKSLPGIPKNCPLCFRETDCAVTQSPQPQPQVLGETEVQGKNKNTVEEQKEEARKNTAGTIGNSQELKKVVFPFFPY